MTQDQKLLLFAMFLAGLIVFVVFVILAAIFDNHPLLLNAAGAGFSIFTVSLILLLCSPLLDRWR